MRIEGDGYVCFGFSYVVCFFCELCMKFFDNFFEKVEL